MRESRVGYRLTEDLVTGNTEIDDEHRELFWIVNLLLDAYNRGDAMNLLKPVIDFLRDHVMEHFKHEEELQEQNHYPGLEEHRAFHKMYREDLERILGRISAENPGIQDMVDLNGHISALINHVKTDDRKMCEYLQKIGINR